MTAPTRSSLVILAATSVTPVANSNKAAPALTGAWVDVRSFNGGDIRWAVTNGTSAPGVQGQFTLQVSDANDGTNVTDLWSGGGNTNASTSTTASPTESGLVTLPNTASYARMICYGHTTNAVTFASTLFAKA